MTERAGILGGGVAAANYIENLDSRELHDMHHMGVDRTLFLARKVIPNINREEVRRVVRTCDRCQSIDPAPSVQEAGEIQVSRN